MRILIVHPHDIHSLSEPWTRRVRALAGEFVSSGHEVKLAYFPLFYAGNQKPHFLDGYEAIPCSRYPSPIVFLSNSLRLIKLGKWADIIHFQKCHHYAAIPAVAAAYINRKPLHYDWDDWEEMIWYESCGRSLHCKFIGFSFKLLERFLPILADTISVSSRNLKDLAIKFGVKEENIYFAPVGADLEEFKPGVDGSIIRNRFRINNTPLVLYIGQLHGAQYIDLFIKAANIVLHKVHNVMFMIVGEGFKEKSLRELVKDLGMEEKVIFAGSIHQHMIPQYLAAADICVAPFRDTKVTRCKSPLKIVEYLSCGKAVVASNVGEVRRMLGGVGILVEAGDARCFAQGILRLLADKALRDNLGRLARQRAERSYSWRNAASNLLAAYEKLARN